MKRHRVLFSFTIVTFLLLGSFITSSGRFIKAQTDPSQDTVEATQEAEHENFGRLG